MRIVLHNYMPTRDYSPTDLPEAIKAVRQRIDQDYEADRDDIIRVAKNLGYDHTTAQMIARELETRDYLPGQQTWAAEIEDGSGKKRTDHVMAASKAEAEQRFKSQYATGKVSNVRSVKTSAPAEKTKRV